MVVHPFLYRGYVYDIQSGQTSPRLKSIVHEGVNYSGRTVECNYTYEYDDNGNITAVSFGNRRQTYVYDANNQLIRENKDRGQYTQTWEYDAFGNILSTSKYAYTTGALGEPTSTVTYGYTDSDWGDLLTEYNGQTIDYDNIGNPLFVRDSEENVVKSYTWTQGRQMATHMTKGVTWSYTYDVDGMRTGRTNGTTTYQYIYAGDKLVRMIRSTASVTDVVDFGYAGGQLATMTYDGVTYYYVLNGQGDVIGLTDNTRKMVIAYHYSAYGVPYLLRADDILTPILKNLNPFMYRGYVYDIETSLYYLQSRYYDSEMGRFINADALVSTGQGILGNNMFAYCRNSPVFRIDVPGTCDIQCGDENPLNDEDSNNDFGPGGANTSASGGQNGGSQTTTSTSFNFGGSKSPSYAAKRGWTNEMISEAIDAGQTGTSTNVRNGLDCDVYSYPGDPVQYVVVESASRNIVQLSKMGDQDWRPDRNIEWK